MKHYNAAMACIMESHIYGNDLSNDEYYWIKGPELLPAFGDRRNRPRRGLGMLVNRKLLPGGAEVKSFEHSFWARFPPRSPGARPLFVCCTHLHVASQPLLRADAWKELCTGVALFKNQGMLAIGGDFNSRCALNGDKVLDASGRELLHFANKQCVTLVNDMPGIVSGKFTRVQKRKRAHSIIDRTTVDYALVSDPNAVQSLSIITDSTLNSDHRPLLLSLEWSGAQDAVASQGGPLVRKLRKPESVREANNFEAVCEAEMVSYCASKPHAPSSQEEIDLSTKLLVDALNRAAVKHFGTCLVGAKSKPWFDVELRAILGIQVLARKVLHVAAVASDAYALAHNVLQEAKDLYKKLSKSKRKAKASSAARELERAFGSSKVFWSKWKAHTRGTSSSSSSIPSSVVDSSGLTVSGDPLKILQVWRDYAEQLGRGNLSLDPKHGDHHGHDQFDDSFARKICDELRADGAIDELANPISWEEVHVAIRRLCDGKAPGPDGIQSDLLKIAGLGCEVALTELFNDIWKARKWPSAWRVANLIPLYKKSGPSIDPSNYRLLAMMDQLPKVFEKILDQRLRAWAERVGTLSDLQGGFRAGRGTVDQIFVLNEIITSRLERGLPTLTCFIDIAKAYDTVWRDGLWVKLQRAGCDEQTLDLLQIMYHSVVRRVMINGRVSSTFNVELGVPQGAVLSPLLYAVYIDGLHDALRKQGLGVWVYGRLVPLLFYADDIVLLASSEAELAAALRVVEGYARQWRFAVNHGKCNVLVFGDSATKEAAARIAWRLGDQVVVMADAYKYLGLDFDSASRGMSGKWNSHLRRMLDKARKGMHLVLFQGGGPDGVCPRTMAHQWCMIGRPLLEYGCELWHGEISVRWRKRLESLQDAFCRASLGLKSTPAASALRADMGVSSLHARRLLLKTLYWKKLCDMSSDRLASLLLRRRHAEVISGHAALSCLNSFKASLLELGLDAGWSSCSALGDWPTLVRNQVRQHELEHQQELQRGYSSLSLYTELGHDFSLGAHSYLLDRGNLLGTRLKSQLRFGVLWLMARVASVLKWPAAGGGCPVCRSGVIEDAEHFLLHCPALARHRTQFRVRLESSLPWVGVAGRALLDYFGSAAPRDALALLAGRAATGEVPWGCRH